MFVRETSAIGGYTEVYQIANIFFRITRSLTKTPFLIQNCLPALCGLFRPCKIGCSLYRAHILWGPLVSGARGGRPCCPPGPALHMDSLRNEPVVTSMSQLRHHVLFIIWFHIWIINFGFFCLLGKGIFFSSCNEISHFWPLFQHCAGDKVIMFVFLKAKLAFVSTSPSLNPDHTHLPPSNDLLARSRHMPNADELGRHHTLDSENQNKRVITSTSQWHGLP